MRRFGRRSSIALRSVEPENARHCSGSCPRLTRRTGVGHLDSRRHEGRRDPRALPVVLRGARPPAHALGVAGAAHLRPDRCCSPPPGCSRSSPTSGARRSRRRSASRRARSASARPTSRTWAHRPAPHVLRDARATSRSATTSSRARRSSPGSCRPRASGSSPSDIWITVFGGDEELGLGPDEEAIECWRAIGVPTSGSCGWAARTTSGSRARPARAGRARSSTSTAALDFGPDATARATTPSASSSSGTSSSCSTSCTPTAR